MEEGVLAEEADSPAALADEGDRSQADGTPSALEPEADEAAKSVRQVRPPPPPTRTAELDGR